MQTRPYTTLLLAGATLAIGQSVLADSPPTVEQLQKQMAEMQVQMDQMRRRLGEDWMSEQRAAEIRGIVQDVLADVDTRSSLLQSGGGAGYDGGFVITSDDGNFKLKLNGQIQVRFTYASIDDLPPPPEGGLSGGDDDDRDRWGFENRRTKLVFAGHVGDRSWQYKVKGAFSNKSGSFGLEEAWVQKDLGNGLEIMFGQFKLPFMFEELTSSSRQLAVDRSLVNEAFNQDYSQGIQVAYEGDSVRWWAAYSDGFGSRNTRGIDVFGSDAGMPMSTNFAITGRVEALVQGDDWARHKDYTSKRGAETSVLVGGALHYQDGRDEITDEEMLAWTVDTSVEFDGANLAAAITGRHLSWDGGGMADMDQIGLVLQGGYRLSDDTEVFGRYEWGDPDSGADDLSVLTVGLNKYYSSKIKGTVDLGYSLNEVAAPFGDHKSIGWRESSEDGQLVLRGQLQLVF